MNEKLVKASIKSLRGSPRKLNLVASLIRKMTVENALVQLSFSSKRIALDVKKCLQSCISNAENNFGLDTDKLKIKYITVGKVFVMKRVMPKAKGRRAIIKKPFSRLDIVLSTIE
ncbi:MAG: 50S ribosomal protein L22 [Rickettsia sp.]|nr:50S ribosomal protein L22 [Rickettsia sp.]